jgi:uncharacterized protein YcbX
MTHFELTGLYVYPVKSMAGISLARAELDLRGIRHDRRWMLVNSEGQFLTQRQLPRMSLIHPELSRNHLTLRAPAMVPLQLPIESGNADRLEVKVWRDRCVACSVGPEAAAWLTRFLGTDCQLVYLPDDVVRPVDRDYAGPRDQLGFADGFPLLVIGQASLDDLNTRLDEPLPLQRFRPNLVIAGARPYAEDRWRRVRVGETVLRLAKPCSRCVITTVDPSTGVRGSEPLRTLASYRRRDNKVFFGQNALHAGHGALTIGDPVSILEFQ